MDEVVEAGSKPAIIFPTAGGNIHQFSAVTDCAVLDILAPPYSPQGGQQTTCAHLSKRCYTCSRYECVAQTGAAEVASISFRQASYSI